ncbi:hypothetical protein BASA83_012097 [Batrachochytrium salamandrivorans]|nr:hypothetical protein BASA83_012097 [Batrachochytrium salamandrivorans]
MNTTSAMHHYGSTHSTHAATISDASNTISSIRDRVNAQDTHLQWQSPSHIFTPTPDSLSRPDYHLHSQDHPSRTMDSTHAASISTTAAAAAAVGSIVPHVQDQYHNKAIVVTRSNSNNSNNSGSTTTTMSPMNSQDYLECSLSSGSLPLPLGQIHMPEDDSTEPHIRSKDRISLIPATQLSASLSWSQNTMQPNTLPLDMDLSPSLPSPSIIADIRALQQQQHHHHQQQQPSVTTGTCLASESQFRSPTSMHPTNTNTLISTAIHRSGVLGDGATLQDLSLASASTNIHRILSPSPLQQSGLNSGMTRLESMDPARNPKSSFGHVLSPSQQTQSFVLAEENNVLMSSSVAAEKESFQYSRMESHSDTPPSKRHLSTFRPPFGSLPHPTHSHLSQLQTTARSGHFMTGSACASQSCIAPSPEISDTQPLLSFDTNLPCLDENDEDIKMLRGTLRRPIANSYVSVADAMGSSLDTAYDEMQSSLQSRSPCANRYSNRHGPLIKDRIPSSVSALPGGPSVQKESPCIADTRHDLNSLEKSESAYVAFLCASSSTSSSKGALETSLPTLSPCKGLPIQPQSPIQNRSQLISDPQIVEPDVNDSRVSMNQNSVGLFPATQHVDHSRVSTPIDSEQGVTLVDSIRVHGDTIPSKPDDSNISRSEESPARPCFVPATSKQASDENTENKPILIDVSHGRAAVAVRKSQRIRGRLAMTPVRKPEAVVSTSKRRTRLPMTCRSGKERRLADKEIEPQQTQVVSPSHGQETDVELTERGNAILSPRHDNSVLDSNLRTQVVSSKLMQSPSPSTHAICKTDALAHFDADPLLDENVDVNRVRLRTDLQECKNCPAIDEPCGHKIQDGSDSLCNKCSSLLVLDSVHTASTGGLFEPSSVLKRNIRRRKESADVILAPVLFDQTRDKPQSRRSARRNERLRKRRSIELKIPTVDVPDKKIGNHDEASLCTTPTKQRQDASDTSDRADNQNGMSSLTTKRQRGRSDLSPFSVDADISTSDWDTTSKPPQPSSKVLTQVQAQCNLFSLQRYAGRTYKRGDYIWALWDGIYYPASVNERLGMTDSYIIVYLKDTSYELLNTSRILPFDLTVGDACHVAGKNAESKGQAYIISQVVVEHRTYRVAMGGRQNRKNVQLQLITTSIALISQNIQRRGILATDEGGLEVSPTLVDRIHVSQILAQKSRVDETMTQSGHSMFAGIGFLVSFPRSGSSSVGTCGSSGSNTNTSTSNMSNGVDVPISSISQSTSAADIDAEAHQKQLHYCLDLPWMKQKEFVVSHVKSAGGHVYDDFTTLFDGHYPRKACPAVVVLISARPTRSKRYIMAVALGIPIVTSLWVQACIDQGSLVDFGAYRLSNGVSLEMGHWCVLPPSTQGVFKNVNIYAFSKDKSQCLEIEAIVHSADAQIVTKKAFRLDGQIDVVVCMNKPTEEDIMAILSRTDAPIATLEWAFQCIINQRLLPVSSHPKYYSWD